MESFEGRLAVVTGGGTGMGRELVIQLAEADILAAEVFNLEGEPGQAPNPPGGPDRGGQRP